jgi:phage gpG-like protein
MNVTPEQIIAEAERLTGRGVEAAMYFFAARVKEVLSVPAPRRTVIAKDGTRYYRAATKAAPGAPPRKLSGRLRTSIATEFDPVRGVGRVGSNVAYARRQEFNGHPFLMPTFEANRDNISRIIGSELRG